jgi:soluble lytic murein transglycosylase-like protein
VRARQAAAEQQHAAQLHQLEQELLSARSIHTASAVAAQAEAQSLRTQIERLRAVIDDNAVAAAAAAAAQRTATGQREGLYDFQARVEELSFETGALTLRGYSATDSVAVRSAGDAAALIRRHEIGYTDSTTAATTTVTTGVMRQRITELEAELQDVRQIAAAQQEHAAATVLALESRVTKVEGVRARLHQERNALRHTVSTAL